MSAWVGCSAVGAKGETVEEYVVAAARGMSISHAAAAAPDRLAIISEFGDRTFAHLDERANRLARTFRNAGLRPGDGVALLCRNRPEFVEVVAAVARTGLRLTCVNWHLTAGEIGYIVDDCEARAFIADAGIGDVAAAVLATSGADPALRLAISGPGGGSIAGFDDYDDALAAADPAPIEDAVLGGVMLYTSGTTGRPKGVRRPPVPPTTLTINTGGYIGATDRHLCTGPLYHAAPLGISLQAPLLMGAGVVLMEHWDTEEALRLVEHHRITHTHMVPTMFHRMLALPDEVKARYDLSSLRLVVHGAAPCPVPVKQALIEWLGPVVWEYYAATEGAGTLVDSATWLTKPGTVGRGAVPGWIVVRDEDGHDLPTGETGTVYLRASKIDPFEYWKDADKTAKTYDGASEYYTLGDVGHLDEDGFLFLTDRSANLIISGGVNIYPAEVDAVLLTHPAVADAATIGVPDDEWGERVVAVIELKPAYRPGNDDLRAALLEHCRADLAGFKCPRQVDFIDTLPRQENGKLYKRLLREQYRSAAAAHSPEQPPQEA